MTDKLRQFLEVNTDPLIKQIFDERCYEVKTGYLEINPKIELLIILVFDFSRHQVQKCIFRLRFILHKKRRTKFWMVISL